MGFIVAWASDTWLSLRRNRRTLWSEDSSHGGCCPSPSGYAVAGILALLGGACAAGEAADRRGRDSEASVVLQARAVAEGQVDLPERTDVLDTAAALERYAAREGAGARVVSLDTTAAKLLERLWRVEGREQDARKAIDLYRAASLDVGAQGACPAAVAAARLSGDVEHDAAATYAELYNIERRLAPAQPVAPGASPSCRGVVGDELRLLVAFRPPREVLDAIDDGLMSAGAIPAAADAGATTRAASPTVAWRPLPSGMRPNVTRVEWWPGRDAARVVLVLDRPAHYRLDDAVAPARADTAIAVDLDGVELGSMPTDTPTQGIVTRIRTQLTGTGSQLCLDTDGRAWRRAFEMREPYRVIVDVARAPGGVQGRGPRTVSRIVLDPGHGGWDRGAHGPKGIEEKEVALDIAHRVAPVLEAQGVQVALTRDDDRYISLEERTGRANAFGADLFVSIHCNASEGRVRRGVEAYILDTSRDEIASRVAARENATTQAAATSELVSILSSMKMADEARRSRRLAQLLLRASTTSLQTKYGDAVDGGLHAAGFYVLVGARMPAVLFETSYISNAIDAQRLATTEYRQLLADAIVNAVRAYREGR
jgi:N-acetylmuramoyl-L-alanine amidase